MIDASLTLAAANPVDHVVNHGFFKIGDIWVWSAHTGNLILAALIVIAGGLWAAGKIETGPESDGTHRFVTRNRFAHMLEVICVYLKENTVRPLLGDRTDRFMPFLWTLFFFILVNNLLGLVPILDLFLLNKSLKSAHESPFGGTATQNIYVTGGLALISFIVINAAGIKQLGIKGYLMHLTGGAPAYIWPILVPVEILGTFIKPIALAIRLFANMTAGHILVATLFGFVGSAYVGGLLLFGTVGVLSAIGALAIYFLEIFVGFLQAFVFMFLTTVFISQLDHHGDHDHDHAHEPVAAH
ncbi:MAG: F0F1 ATP synthase subunit A [Planctomycetota bacterium]